MSTARPFAYNTGSTIPGTIQVGDLSVGTPIDGFPESPVFWNGPDEELGYVIAIPVSGNTQPTPLTDNRLYLSPTYKAIDIALSNNNQTATQIFSYQQSVLGETLISSEKMMFSVQFNSTNPSVGIGGRFIGVGRTSMNYQGPFGGYPGNDGLSSGFSDDGKLYYNGSVLETDLPTWDDGDIIDIAVAGGNGLWWIRVNGGYWNGDISADPATNDGGLNFEPGDVYPVLCPYIYGIMTIQNTSIYGVPTSFLFLGNTLASIKFIGTKNQLNPLNDSTFIGLVNQHFNQSFTAGSDASIWLTTNGYWNSYDSIVLYLDAGNTLSYPTTGTSWYDLSIKDYTGTLINGASFNSNNGGSIVFDGTNDGVTIVMPTPTSTKNSLSFDFWLLSTGQTATLQSILAKGLPNDVTTGYIRIYRQTSTDDLRYSYANGSAHLQTNIPNFFNGYNNTWLNLQITFNYSSGSFNVYRNGVLFFNTTITNSPLFPTKTGTAYVGLSSFGSGSPFNGKISVVKIYNKELTSTDVTQNFDSVKSRYGL